MVGEIIKMNKGDYTTLIGERYLIYKGIIKNNFEFCSGSNKLIKYDFSDEHFIKLRDTYDLKRFKTNSEFETSLKIMHYFAPHLKHESNYDNHVNCNSLDLLEYAYINKNGINCLNKAKIIVECLLALNIYARRAFLMPYSPYDLDNHVVLEVYDEVYAKWIMIDPTINGYFIDENKNPLSCLEIRKIFAENRFTTAIVYHQRATNIYDLEQKNTEINCYFAKNFCYFYVDSISGFGDSKKRYCIKPVNFDLLNREITNLDYKIKKSAPKSLSKTNINRLKNQLRLLKNNHSYQVINYNLLSEKPNQKIY